MSAIAITSSGSGAGTLSIAAPITATNRTLTLPDETGTFVTSGSSTYLTSKIQPITASVASSAMTVTLNPTVLDFRSTPLTSGTVNTRTVSAAISVVVPSTATLGTVSATQSRIVVLALDNAGTIELAVVNISGGSVLDETTLISTTAIAAASNSATAYYSTTARTSLPYRVVGYIESTQATAGTWATAPSTIQGYGGQALAAMSSLGYGQTWQSFTVGTTRVSGTTYYNTTGKPIVVMSAPTGTAGTLQPMAGGVNLSPTVHAINTSPSFNFVVPPGQSYAITATTTAINTWYELR